MSCERSNKTSERLLAIESIDSDHLGCEAGPSAKVVPAFKKVKQRIARSGRGKRPIKNENLFIVHSLEHETLKTTEAESDKYS